jgi:probable rRNA maturation factor
MADPAIVVGGPRALPARVVRETIVHVLRGESRRAAISVTFLGWRAMRRLNHAHLGRDRSTDVIAFALPQPDGSLAGDLYVCRPQAVREAHHRGIRAREELLRLLIHGTLHLLGHDHPEGADRERSAMWRTQERYLAEVLA